MSAAIGGLDLATMRFPVRKLQGLILLEKAEGFYLDADGIFCDATFCFV